MQVGSWAGGWLCRWVSGQVGGSLVMQFSACNLSGP